jgi:hypothetical protein
MSGFVAFCRKEWLEQVRTFRLPITLIAFVLVGLGSPLLAKLTPVSSQPAFHEPAGSSICRAVAPAADLSDGFVPGAPSLRM